MITASAPGKIILFGEHAVVYGQPAIAVPFAALRVTVSPHPAPPGSGLEIDAPDVRQRLPVAGPEDRPFYNALIYPLRLALDALGSPAPDLRLTVRSTLPIGGGLGSGAALATALIRALGLALDRPFDPAALNALVYEVEKRHHGSPSGIDNTVIVYEQPVYFVRGQPLEFLSIARPLTLLVADSGISSPTRLTVGDMRALHEANPARTAPVFEQIGALVQQARRALETGSVDALGPLMDQNHALLRALTVSSALLDRLCAAARDAGARGAKLSGGGRGGSLIVLVDEEQAAAVDAALRRAGAVQVIRTTVRGPQ